MKKYLIAISLAILFISVLTSCSKTSDTEKGINTDIPESHSLTEPEYTAGAVGTSQKISGDDKTYDLAYFDSEGRAVKLEHYKNGKLHYYQVSSALDESGNSVREEYYSADGKKLAIYEDGFFFNASNEQISEDMMEAILNDYE